MPTLITMFLTRFSALSAAGLDVIQANLEDARLRVDPKVWLYKADMGVMYLAASTIDESPGGNAFRAEGGKPSRYRTTFEAMRAEVAAFGRPLP